MRTKLIYIFAILFTVHSFGQRKSAADRYFKEFSYVKSAEMYNQIFMKGDSSKIVLERLADSYYFNADVQQAEPWYKKLINNYPQEVAPKYYFRYAQVLKANGNYEESDKIMKKFYSLSPESSGETLASTPDYVSVYSENTNELVNIHNVSVNTEYSDFGGFLRDDVFYFATSKPRPSSRNRIYSWNDQPYLDLYESTTEIQKLEDGSEEQIVELKDRKILNDEINTRYHESNAVITKDGQTMYFTRDNYDGKRKRRSKKDRRTYLKIYKAQLVNGIWDKVEELPFNSDDYSNGHPALSPDEKTLYFVSNMPGTIGATDIYKVAIEENGYGEVKNLGKEINTIGREMFPFVTEDNVLYFSSDGHLGLGLLDIFESKVEGNLFTKPKNVEAPFNSKMDDFAFYINQDKTKGFFSSNREGGKGDDDIYSFMISKTPPKPCMQSINGIVTEKQTGNILPDATVKLLDVEGKVIATQQSDAQGAYNFTEAPCEASYTVVGEKHNYKADSKSVTTTKEDEAVQKADLALEALIIGNEIVINPIFFDFDKSNIRDEASYELEKVVSVMQNNPDMVIKIESHTDCRGTKRYNRNLSDRRAKSTRDYIISRGIAANRIESAIGYGEDQLLFECNNGCDSCSEEQHQRNRRSKFIIVSGGKNINVTNPLDAPLKKIDPKPGREGK